MKFGDAVSSYILNINPGRWTHHANMTTSTPVPATGGIKSPRPLLMFVRQSSNFVESDNSAMANNGIRDFAPYDAILTY